VTYLRKSARGGGTSGSVICNAFRRSSTLAIGADSIPARRNSTNQFGRKGYYRKPYWAVFRAAISSLSPHPVGSKFSDEERNLVDFFDGQWQRPISWPQRFAEAEAEESDSIGWHFTPSSRRLSLASEIRESRELPWCYAEAPLPAACQPLRSRAGRVSCGLDRIQCRGLRS
jgi:hypothetical protein